MAIRKRTQKQGGSHALLLTKAAMQQLGLPDGGTVLLEFVGDTLLVRREGADAPEPLKVMLALGGLETAFPADLKEGAQRLLLALRAYGPLTVAEVAERLGLTRGGAQYGLDRAVERGHAELVGGSYRLADVRAAVSDPAE